MDLFEWNGQGADQRIVSDSRLELQVAEALTRQEWLETKPRMKGTFRTIRRFATDHSGRPNCRRQGRRVPGTKLPIVEGLGLDPPGHRSLFALTEVRKGQKVGKQIQPYRAYLTYIHTCRRATT